MTTNELYWLAGMYEGEGSFVPGPPSRPNVPRATLVSTDHDVIQKVAALTPGAIITSVPSRDPRHKDKWRIVIYGPRAVALMLKLRPLMGKRRQAAIDRAVATYRPKTQSRLAAELGLESDPSSGDEYAWRLTGPALADPGRA